MKNSGNVYNIDVCLIKKELATILFCGFSMTQQDIARNHFVQTITMNNVRYSKPCYRADISFQNVKTKCLFIYERLGVSMEKFILRYQMNFISFASNECQLLNKLVLRNVVSDSLFTSRTYLNQVFIGNILLRTGVRYSGR